MPSEYIESNNLDHNSQALLFATFPHTDGESTRQKIRGFLAEMREHVGKASYEFISGRYRHDILTVDLTPFIGQKTTNPDWIVKQVCMRSANSQVPLTGTIVMETEKTRRVYLVQGSVIFEEKEDKSS